MPKDQHVAAKPALYPVWLLGKVDHYALVFISGYMRITMYSMCIL